MSFCCLFLNWWITATYFLIFLSFCLTLNLLRFTAPSAISVFEDLLLLAIFHNILCILNWIDKLIWNCWRLTLLLNYMIYVFNVNGNWFCFFPIQSTFNSTCEKSGTIILALKNMFTHFSRIVCWREIHPKAEVKYVYSLKQYLYLRHSHFQLQIKIGIILTLFSRS